MKNFTKFLAPTVLVLASFSASAAGLTETDYPLDQQRYSMTMDHQGAAQAMPMQTGAAPALASGVLEMDYPSVQPRQHAMPGHAAPMDAQRPSVSPTQQDLGSFA